MDIGPHCTAVGIFSHHLDERTPLLTEITTNGVVLEIFTNLQKKGKTISEIADTFACIDSRFKDVNPTTLNNRIKTITEKKKKLASKKKVVGVKNVTDLLNAEFLPRVRLNVKKSESQSREVDSDHKCSAPDFQDNTNDSDNKLEKTVIATDKTTSNTSYSADVKSTAVQTENETCKDETTKKWNLKKYLCNKQTRQLRKINKLVKSEEEKFKKISDRVGHYAVKNVNKRDETAKKNLRLLREAQRQVRKLKLELQNHRDGKTVIDQLRKDADCVRTELEKVQEKLITEKARKLTAQKNNSKLRSKLKSATTNSEVKTDWDCEIENSYECLEEKIVALTNKLSEKELSVSELQEQVEELEERKKITTKQSDGTYTDNIRHCVIQLAGLEVATEKVRPVIEVVLSCLFGLTLQKNDLPNSSSVQRIVDEGHYIAKSYIAERLDSCENWGLSRDGTTRKKQKIVDTSVTLDNGEVTSLGFTNICRETAQTIHEVTKTHLTELAQMHRDTTCGENSMEQNSDSDFLQDALAKLSYTMSDRASNEKLADRLLSDWRTEVLNDCSEQANIHAVENFHCMAHVLLGFHKYTCDNIKVIETDIVKNCGPLGRDSLPVFKFWSKKGTVIERAVRTTAEVFGPAGDHHGLRDRWESYCASNGTFFLNFLFF